MPPACPEPEQIAAYRHGGLPAGEREEVERHCVACAPCRQALLWFGDAEARLVAPPRPAWLWRAAAAALLLAPALWLTGRWVQPHVPVHPLQPLPLSSAVLPGGVLGSPGVPTGHLVAGMDLLLDAGARVRAEGRCLRLESGRLWLDAAAPVTLEIQGKAFTLQDAAVAARVMPVRRAAWLLTEALAEELPLAELCVLRGKVGNVGAGRKLLLGPQGWTEDALTGEETASLWKARCAAAVALPGRDLVSGPLKLSGQSPSVEADLSLEAPQTFRWVTVITGRTPATELGFTLRTEHGWRTWVAGLGARAPGAREVLELTWDGERLVQRVDGVPSLTADRAHLEEALRPADREAWGISAWEGEAVLQRSVLRED